MRFLKKLLGRDQDAPEPASEQDQFAALVLDALRHADPTIEVDYRPAGFEFVHPEGQKTFLVNSYLEYCRLPKDERPMQVHRLAAFIIDSRKPLPEGEEALDALLPVLRSRADLIATTSEMPAWPYERSSRPFCDTMLLMLAIDTERAIALVTDETLDGLGMSFEDALAIATGHLDERGNHNFGQLGEGTFVSTCEDHYDASRILLPGLIETLPVKGKPVAIVEARSAVLVTGSEDMEGLAQIAGFAWEDFPENERAVSLTPIMLEDGEWRPFPIAPHHPQSLKNLAAYQAQWSYGATQAVLQTALSDDLFVANPILFKNDSDDRIATFASWAAGVPTACPIVDAVVIQEQGEFPAITRRLEDVIAVCGPFPAVTEMPYPPRLTLPGQPDDAQRRILTDDYPAHEAFPG